MTAEPKPEQRPRAGIVSLRLCGFRRYDDETMTLEPGVNFLEGPNNAGKTTVLYGIEYALFGRVGLLTPEGLIRPGAEGMGVQLIFDARDGKRYRLQRVHLRKGKRKTLIGHFTLKRIEPDGAEQYVLSSDFDDREDHLASALHSALGVGRRGWDLAVHLRQGAIPELLEGNAQLDIVLGVTPAVFVEEELRTLAREREKALEELPAIQATLSSVDAERTARRARLAALETELQAERAKVAGFDEAKAALARRRKELEPTSELLSRLATTERAVERATEGLARTEAEVSARGVRAELEAALQGAREKVATLSAGKEGDKELQQTLRETSRALERERGDLSARLSRRKKLTGVATCEHCGQPIDATHLEREAAELEQALADVDARIGQTEEALKNAQREAEARQEAVTAAKVAERDAERALADLARAEEAHQRAITELAQAKEKHQSALAEVPGGDVEALRVKLAQEQDAIKEESARLEADHRHLRERVSRLEMDQKRESEGLKVLERQYAEASSRRAQIERDAELAAKLRALNAGFKVLQQDLRERATVQLGQRALALHALLSGADQEIGQLSIDPKGYAVMVTPHDVGTEVPAALYQGGGHRLLLGLAFRLALAEHLGPIPFVLLDEPTYGLDADRRAQLLSRVRSLEVADQLLVITHHEVGQEGSRRIRVVPDGAQSRLEVA